MDSAQRPASVGVRPEGLPEALTRRPQWVCWNWFLRDGVWTKPPVTPAGRGPFADNRDPATWGTFAAALDFHRARRTDGIGYVFGESDPFAGVDFDRVRDPATGAVLPWAAEALVGLDTFADISPSDGGVKAVVEGKLPPGRRKRGHPAGGAVEMYDRHRYFTLTGRPWDADRLPVVRPAQRELLHWHTALLESPPWAVEAPSPVTEPVGPLSLSDEEVLARVRRSAVAEKFDRLWRGDSSAHGDDDSAADLAFCDYCRFFAGPYPDLIDRLFRASGRMRPKWDRRAAADGRTYGRLTIDRALAGAVADPRHDAFEIRYTPGGDNGEAHAPPDPPPAGGGSAKKAEGIFVYEHDDLLAAEFSEQPWLVDGLVPDGSLTVLGGKKKLGKSWLCLQVAQAVATGGEVLGRQAAQGGVLYLCLEDGARRLQDRLRKQSAPAGLPVAWVVRFPRLDRDGWPALVELVGERRPRLLVIDTLAAAKSAKTVENDSGPMGDLANALREQSQHRGMATVLVHHHGKHTSGDPGDDLRGSSALGGAGDLNLGLYRVQPDADPDAPLDPARAERSESWLKGEGRDIEPFALPILFHAHSSWRWEPTDPPDRGGNRIRRKVADVQMADAVRRLGEASANKVAAVLSIDPDTARRRLNRLTADGFLASRLAAPEGGRPSVLYRILESDADEY